MTLTDGERASALWSKLHEHFSERIDMLRAKNDAEGLDPAATAVLRGRIAELKALCSLDKDAPVTD